MGVASGGRRGVDGRLTQSSQGMARGYNGRLRAMAAFDPWKGVGMWMAAAMLAVPTPFADWTESLIRLGLAALLGAIVGLERQTHGRAAGLRTMMLVSLGCCLVMLVSNAVAEAYWAYRDEGMNIIRIDPARLAYSVMGGIGFLGAGAILKSGFSIRGLTTAATIWCVAAIGLAVGMGMYFHGIVTMALVMVALFVLDRVEGVVEAHWYKIVEVTLPETDGCIEEFQQKMQALSAKVLDMQLERLTDGAIRVVFNVRLPNRRALVPLFEALSREPEVRGIVIR